MQKPPATVENVLRVARDHGIPAYADTSHFMLAFASMDTRSIHFPTPDVLKGTRVEDVLGATLAHELGHLLDTEHQPDITDWDKFEEVLMGGSSYNRVESEAGAWDWADKNFALTPRQWAWARGALNTYKSNAYMRPSEFWLAFYDKATKKGKGYLREMKPTRAELHEYTEAVHRFEQEHPDL